MAVMSHPKYIDAHYCAEHVLQCHMAGALCAHLGAVGMQGADSYLTATKSALLHSPCSGSMTSYMPWMRSLPSKATMHLPVKTVPCTMLQCNPDRHVPEALQDVTAPCDCTKLQQLGRLITQLMHNVESYHNPASCSAPSCSHPPLPNPATYWTSRLPLLLEPTQNLP